MNKYVILERQEQKVNKLEEEKRLIHSDIFKVNIRDSNSSEQLDATEKRIKSLKRKRDYLEKKIRENASRENNPLGLKATEKVSELLARLEYLLTKRKHSSSNGNQHQESLQ